MAIKGIKEEQCTGCGVCADNCQMDVFKIDADSGKARIVYPQDCVVCYTCKYDCPQDAIILTPESVARLWFAF